MQISLGADVILNATAAGFGVATGPVLFDETRCVGDETRLINCRHNGVGTLNCDHSRDVGLRCRIRKIFPNEIHHGVVYSVFHNIQLSALTVMSDWLVVRLGMRDVWSSVTMKDGGQSAVVLRGTQWMLKLYAVSWDFQ